MNKAFSIILVLIIVLSICLNGYAEDTKTENAEEKTEFIPPVEMTQIKVVPHKSIIFYWKNNTNETINKITIYFTHYNDAGRYIDEAIYVSGCIGSSITLNTPPIKPGETLEYEITGFNIYKAKAAIKEFHTVEGYDYEYNLEQLHYVSSDDNEYLEPAIECYPEKMSDKEMNAANSVKVGYFYKVILPEVSTYYLLGEGGRWLNVVTEGSCADRAGLMPDDLVLKFDDLNIFDAHATEKAKLKMLKGEKVTITYLRANKQYQTTIAMDMDALEEEQEKSNNHNTEQTAFINELMQLAELYKAGLLTDEEFTAAKQKLLGN